MRLAVYAIALNEAKHAERFMRSIGGEADLVVVADTGSTDGTREILREHGAVVHAISVSPWRFDVARNDALRLVPEDVDACFALDLDEVLHPGWRAAVERAWTRATNRLRYDFVWSHRPDGTPAVSYRADKLHGRRSHLWRCPVHETLRSRVGQPEVYGEVEGFVVHHWPDDAKPRSSYLPLLEMAAREDPDDDRTAHYLGRELMFVGRHAEAIAELVRHLALPSARWEPERAASMRFLARSCCALGRWNEARAWLLRACAEAPGTREPWVELARLLHHERDWLGTAWAVSRALAIVDRPPTYICEPEAWGALPHDLASVSAWQLGRRDEALVHGRRAAALDPGDARLAGNVAVMSAITAATIHPTPKEGQPC